MECKALPRYQEPEWVTKQFIDTGKLPPAAEVLTHPKTEYTERLVKAAFEIAA